MTCSEDAAKLRVEQVLHHHPATTSVCLIVKMISILSNYTRVLTFSSILIFVVHVCVTIVRRIKSSPSINQIIFYYISP